MNNFMYFFGAKENKMGCVKLHILDEQYKNAELRVSYSNKELTPNFELKPHVVPDLAITGAYVMLFNHMSHPEEASSPKGDKDDIWGEISIKARGLGEGSSSLDGHSWIEMTDSYGKTTSYGTWGNQGEQQFFINFEGDLGSHYDAVYTKQITVGQKARFDNFISNSSNTKWSYTKNCSYFSTKAFNYTTGSNLMAHPYMIPIYTPSYLVRAINKNK